MKNTLLIVSIALNVLFCLSALILGLTWQSLIDSSKAEVKKVSTRDKKGSYSYNYTDISNLNEAIKNPDKNEYVEEWIISAWKNRSYPELYILYQDSTQDGKLNTLQNLVHELGKNKINYAWEFDGIDDSNNTELMRLHWENPHTMERIVYDDYNFDGIFDGYQKNDDYFILYENSWREVVEDESGNMTITIEDKTIKVKVDGTKWVKDESVGK